MFKVALPAEAEAYKLEVKAWLADHPDPSPQQLAKAGYVAPHWPKPWGRDASPIEQIAIDEVFKQARVRRPQNQIGLGWAGPTIIYAGSEEQKKRYIPGILDGSEVWCQLFSEPGAGSDLAAVSTRAIRDGDEWVINGQKIWTSAAGVSKFGILLARTDPEAAKHSGITYFICPMKSSGVEIRPIKEMSGASSFNEVFLTDVRIPGENVVGEVGQGWDLAKVTLANERVSLSEGGAIWGRGPTVDDLLDLVRSRGGVADLVLRQQIAKVWGEGQLLKMLRMRIVGAALRGRAPGPESSVRKLQADIHGQEIFQLARKLMGTAGVLRGVGPLGGDDQIWDFGFLFSPALTIGGGTAQVQGNIIGERVLGLPREPDVDAPRSS